MGILECIGNTPLVRLEKINPFPAVTILAKLEGNNPGGSVKDRIAYYMIKDAEESGLLKRGDTILGATSGNTGIGLAMIGAAKGNSSCRPASASNAARPLRPLVQNLC